jgi:hypothetical protein
MQHRELEEKKRKKTPKVDLSDDKHPHDASIQYLGERRWLVVGEGI